MERPNVRCGDERALVIVSRTACSSVFFTNQHHLDLLNHEVYLWYSLIEHFYHCRDGSCNTSIATFCHFCNLILPFS